MSKLYVIELHRPYGNCVGHRTETSLAQAAKSAHLTINLARRQAGPYAVFVHCNGIEIPLDELADVRLARRRSEGSALRAPTIT